MHQARKVLHYRAQCGTIAPPGVMARLPGLVTSDSLDSVLLSIGATLMSHWKPMLSLILVALMATNSAAQQTETPAMPPDAAPAPGEPPLVEDAATTADGPRRETGPWWEWERMTGDWGGARTQLEDAGVFLSIDYTQVLQGNARGGRSTTNAFRASGLGTIELKLDTGRLGMWPGGTFVFLGDAVWGGGIDRKVGSLVPVNLNAALPGSAEPGFGLSEGARFLFSEWFYQHVFMEGKLILLGGKLWGARAFDTNVFANDHRTQFMNTALRNNVQIPQFLPYTTLGVGAIVNPLDWLSIKTAVADTDGRAKTTGFETAFHGPMNTTVIHEWEFKVKPFGLPGHQRGGFVWSSKDFQRLDPPQPFKGTADMMIDLLGLDLANKLVNTVARFEKASDNVMAYYNFDQYLYTKEDDPTQGIGLFGRFGWARQDVNPVVHFYSIGLGGKGLLPDRQHDTYGVGYYYAGLSNRLPSILRREQGVEAYYNIRITPWLHISPDLQIIMDPGGTRTQDTSIVYGVRMHVNL
jgi:porin